MPWFRSATANSFRRILPVLAAFLPLAGRAEANETILLLDVFVNEQPTHLLVELIDRDDHLLVRADDAAEMGLAVGPANKNRTSGLIDLQTIPGLSWMINQQRQELRLKAQDRALRPQQLGPGSHPDLPVAAMSGFGAVLNYDLVGTQIGSDVVGSGTFEAHAFSPWGTATTSWIAQTGLQGEPLLRLDTTLSHEDPARLQRWQLGDSIAGSLDWTRPFRFGGFQLASNFALRPDLVTFPVPSINGRADVPSTMDLFINGVREASHDVAPGPFQLQQPPLVTGAGNIAVVVRDPSGRETVQTLNFYTSSSLLAPGLNAYSIDAGWLRQNYGLIGDSYTRPAGSATVRTGLTNWLTLENHVELSQQAIMGGTGSTVSLLGFAVATVSVAASNPATSGTGRYGVGLEYSIGLQRVGKRFSFSASTTRTLSAFQDVSTTSINPVPRRVDRLGLGFSLGRAGNLNLAYAAESGGTLVGTVAEADRMNAKVVSATYTRPLFRRMQFYATGYRLLSGGGTGATVGLVIPLGRRSSASMTTDLEAGRPTIAADFQQVAMQPGDVGWNVLASQGANARETAQSTYLSRMGTVSAEIDHAAGQTGTRAELSGALVAMPQGAFVANQIRDSFAVVDTNGIAGVTVEQENRPVGRTNSDGLLLLPNLNGWQSNRISLDPADLPADADVATLQRQIVPGERSGVHVSFNVTRGHSALIQLVDARGRPIEAGAMARLVSANRETADKQGPVGYDGEVFFDGLQGHNRIVVQTRTGQCVSVVSFVALKNNLPRIGPVPCVAGPPP